MSDWREDLEQVFSELRSVAYRDAADYASSPLKYASKLKALELLVKLQLQIRDAGMLPTDTGEPIDSSELAGLSLQARGELLGLTGKGGVVHDP